MIALSSYYFMQAVLTVVTLYYLPLYLQHEGYSVAQVGLLISAGSVTSIVAQPLWGIVADRWRRMKKLLIVLLALSLAAGSLLFQMETLLLASAGFSLFMFFYSPVVPLADTLAIDYTNRTGSSYGNVRLWGSAGLSLGSLLFGIAFGHWGIAPLPVVFATMCLLLIAVASQLPSGSNRQVKPLQIRHLRELMGDRKYLGYLFAIMIIAVPFRMNDQLFSVFMKMRGATDFQVGLSWSIATLCSIPAYFLSGRLVQRYGETRLLVFAGWMFALRWVTVAWLYDPIWLIVHQVMNLVTVPIIYVAAVLQVTKLVPPHLQATGQAVFTAVFAGVAGFIGSTAGGWGMEKFEPGEVYFAGGVVAAVGTLLTFLWSKYEMERRTAHGAERIL
ncbi:MFS transporter [Paenibacillus thalictri]|uniref:MFS transporter n=1 Tax=Paenibacillus thalictri TaxID=2527873 RepID=A0A4Q9DYA9_9BACL|nr:MFS transporter [Paenibacillus thalictri]TBL80838.1 MFS transporter [Paenibacillus thalictri]